MIILKLIKLIIILILCFAYLYYNESTFEFTSFEFAFYTAAVIVVTLVWNDIHNYYSAK